MAKNLNDNELKKVNGGTGEIYWHYIVECQKEGHPIQTKENGNYSTQAQAQAQLDNFVAVLMSHGYTIINAGVYSGERKYFKDGYFVVY